MTVELSLSNCDLLGLLTHQPRVGFELLRVDGCIAYATQSARRLMYGSNEFDPTDRQLTDVEGPLVGSERHSWVQAVCCQQDAMRYEFVRHGRLMTTTMWPIRSLPSTPVSEADAALAMVTYAISPSTLLLSGHFELPVAAEADATETEAKPQSLMLSGTSAYASWGSLSELTPREREVLVLIGFGKSQKEIAEALNISSKTIETHRMRLGKKLNVVTGAELVRIAFECGIELEHASLDTHANAAWMIADDAKLVAGNE